MKITIYTDGSSRGNPGPGGWASVILTESEVFELGGREDMTTNNRMELMGAIMGFREVDDRHRGVLEVEVCTDSEYVKKGISEWIHGWIKNGWKTSTKKEVLNKDLWQDLLLEKERLTANGVKVMFTYVPGHAGVSLNERADVIATACADNASHLQLYRGARSEYSH